MKCLKCGQYLAVRLMGNIGQPLVCINPKCAAYFEPMAMPPKEVEWEGTNKIYVTNDPLAELAKKPDPEPERGHGIKLDADKVPVYTEFLMQFPRAIQAVARIGAEGTQAPGHVRSGWQGVPQGYERYSNALGRHILDEIIWATTPTTPEEVDPDYELMHAAATVAWNAMARLELLLREHPERLDTSPAP
jgi:Domain of unknown function (DUF5664)